MPQSLSLIICHIIFSTKDREPFIDQDIRGSLHGYLATVVRDMDCTCYWAGGTCDHVHLAVRITRTIEVAALVEKIKTASSVWMKEQDRRFKKFAWQRGYGAFSIGPNSLEKLEKYIDNQQEHHRVVTFKEEYLRILNLYNVEYDERYLWD